MGPGLVRSRQQRHPGPAAHAGRQRRRRTSPGGPRSRGRYGRSPAGDAEPHRPAGRPPAAGRCCPRSRPTPPGGPRRWPRCCSTGTASSSAARSRPNARPVGSRRSTGCWRLRGDRPLPPRLLRRGSRCGAVRTARRRRPARVRSAPRSERSREGPRPHRRRRARGPSCWPRPTRRTRSARPLPWPGRRRGRRHKPGRKAGALVVLVDGRLVLYVERGGRTLLTWAEEPGLLQPAVDALALAVREGQLGRLTVERADGAGVARLAARPARSRRPASTPPRAACGCAADRPAQSSSSWSWSLSS